MPKNNKDKHEDNLQQKKRRNSPTATQIKESLREKYPIGWSIKPKGK